MVNIECIISNEQLRLCKFFLVLLVFLVCVLNKATFRVCKVFYKKNIRELIKNKSIMKYNVFIPILL